MQKKTIQIKCKGSRLVELSKLKIIQGELKALSPENEAKLRKRITEKGFDAPFFVWRNKILDGTQRKKVLDNLLADGWTIAGGKVPVCDIKAKNLAEAKDRLLGYVSQFGKLSTEGLSEFLASVPDVTFDLDSLDLPDFDLERFRRKYIDKTVERVPDDEVPDPPKKAKTKTGDLYLLGDHRLLCGDATKAEDVERVMGGEKADMVFTDPPYGMNLDVDYDSMFKKDCSHKNKGKRFNSVKGDDGYFDPSFMFELAAEVVLWGADYYCQSLPLGGSWYCWDKRLDENMDKVVGNCMELCWSKKPHKREVARILWSGHHGMSKGDTKKRVHPTQKPIELVEWFFERLPGKLILDPFLGSGTTIIAAEKLNRKCYGLEIDPIYCDVIVKRWENYTGRKATLERKSLRKPKKKR